MELDQIERVIENAGLYTYLGKIDKIVGTTVESTGPACRLGDVAPLMWWRAVLLSWPRWWDSGKIRCC